MITYNEALRFDPASKDEKEDIAREFSQLTGESFADSYRLLEWTLATDRAIKMRMEKPVQRAPLDVDVSKDKQHMMLWLTHRLREPGRKRAASLEFAYRTIKQHEDKQGVHSVVDFGGGGGNDAVFYAKNGFDTVCADLPSAQDEHIRKRFKERGLNCTLEDVTALPTERTFDVLHSMDVVEHVYNVEDVLAQMLVLVRPGGLMVIEADCFNVEYRNVHLEKNRFYYKKLDSLFRGYADRVASRDNVVVFKRTGGKGRMLDEIKADLYRRTVKRAVASLVVLYPLLLLTPAEAVFWRLCRAFPAPLSRVISWIIKRDAVAVRDYLPNYLFKRENYLTLDRFSDAVSCLRIATTNLKKLRA